MKITNTISLTDFISITTSIVALFLSYRAIRQTNRSIETSNKQFLFDRKMEVYVNLKYILKVDFSVIENFDISKENRDYFTKNDNEQNKKSEQLKSFTDQFLATLINNSNFHSKVTFLNCENSEEYMRSRLDFLIYVEKLKESKNNAKFFFKDKEIIETINKIISLYIDLIESYNTFYYSYFNGNTYTNGVLFNHLGIITENQLKLDKAIKNIDLDNLDKAFEKEISFNKKD